MIDKLEAKRQMFHIITGAVIAFLIYSKVVDFAILLAITAAGFLLSYLSKRIRIPVISWFLDQFDRKKDVKKMPGKGALFYLIGTLIVYGLFITHPDGKNIVTASIMILALGDAIPLFVAHVGKVKHPFNDKKYIEASMAGAMAGFLGAVFFVHPLQALLGSFVAMFIEGIDLKMGIDIDDNIIVPFFAATTIWLVGMWI